MLRNENDWLFLIIVIIGAILRLGLSIHYRLWDGLELVVEMHTSLF